MGLFDVVLCATLAFAPAPDDPPPLKIIYAGDPDTPHARTCEEFLGNHFPHVTTIPVDDLGEADLSGGDVLIVDGKVLLKREGGGIAGTRKAPPGLSLEKLRIPTILIGGMGGRVADSLKLKLGWKYG